MKEELIKLAIEKGYNLIIRFDNDVSRIGDGEYYLWMCGLQKWLREEHEIDVQPICTYKGFRFYHSGITFLKRKQRIIDTIILKDEGMQTRELFNTYELALEKGLIEALKLIKTT